MIRVYGGSVCVFEMETYLHMDYTCIANSTIDDDVVRRTNDLAILAEQCPEYQCLWYWAIFSTGTKTDGFYEALRKNGKVGNDGSLDKGVVASNVHAGDAWCCSVRRRNRHHASAFF